MNPNYYRILSEAIENGLKYSVTRANKYRDDVPDWLEAFLECETHSYIMNEICQYFRFSNSDEPY